MDDHVAVVISERDRETVFILVEDNKLYLQVNGDGYFEPNETIKTQITPKQARIIAFALLMKAEEIHD